MRVYDAIGNNLTHSPSDALQGTSTGSIVNQISAQISSIPLSEMRVIGAAEQEWAPLRRKYNLFLARNLEQTKSDSQVAQITSGDLPLSNSKGLQVVEGDSREVGFMQFARVDEPFLSWDFNLLSEDKRLIGSVNRNFVGFARELFTDTGVYALRMDAAGLASEPGHVISKTGELSRDSQEFNPGMTLDQRAVMLATAVSIDFDYFSRHSNSSGMGFMPLWFPMGGEAAGGAAEAGAVGAGAGGAVAGTEAAESAGALGNATRSVGAGEGAIAGAGTMAGYEAMQHGRSAQQQDESSLNPYANQSPGQGQPDQLNEQEDVWGEDLWGNSRGGGGPGSGQGGNGGQSGGGGGDGEGGSWFEDFFGE